MTDQAKGTLDDREEKAAGKAARRFQREYLVLRAFASFNADNPVSCGLMDISVAGAKLKVDHASPEAGDRVFLQVEAIKVRANGAVVRTFYTPTGLEVAVKFDQLYDEIPGRLLEYKLKSHETRLRQLASDSRRLRR
jgi:hypothetical protein